MRSYELNFSRASRRNSILRTLHIGVPSLLWEPERCLRVAAASYNYIYYALKKKKERWWWQRQLYTSTEVYRGSSLLADLNFQLVSGLYKNFTRMSPSEFEFLIWLEKKSRRTAFRKAISIQERLTMMPRFLASGDSYVSLLYLFKISKQAIRCIVPEVCVELLLKNLRITYR